jgi:hypothetical protein
VCSERRRRKAFEGGLLDDGEICPVDGTSEWSVDEAAEEHPGEVDEKQFIKSEKRYYRSASRSLCQ